MSQTLERSHRSAVSTRFPVAMASWRSVRCPTKPGPLDIMAVATPSADYSGSSTVNRTAGAFPNSASRTTLWSFSKPWRCKHHLTLAQWPCMVSMRENPAFSGILFPKHQGCMSFT